MCDAKPLSATLLEQQLLYYGDIARKPADNVLRKILFQPQSLHLHRPPGRRRRGRPRDNWANKVHGAVLEIAGSVENLGAFVYNKHAWRMAVRRYACSLK